MLAGALLPVLDGDRERARAAVDEAYDASLARRMGAKLGLAEPADEALLTDLYRLLQRNRCDYTNFFRSLSRLPARAAEHAAGDADAPVLDLCIDRAECVAWVQDWRGRLAGEVRPDQERQATMTRSNPKQVLRNWGGRVGHLRGTAGPVRRAASGAALPRAAVRRAARVRALRGAATGLGRRHRGQLLELTAAASPAGGLKRRRWRS